MYLLNSKDPDCTIVKRKEMTVSFLISSDIQLIWYVLCGEIYLLICSIDASKYLTILFIDFTSMALFTTSTQTF